MADSGYIYLSAEGKRRLEDELKRLKTVERPRVVGEISRARDMGDLSENAEYHAAKEKQVHLERKISELEETLTRAKLMPEGHHDNERAILLSFVVVKEVRSGEQIRYQLVSPEEADFDRDRISIHSPVGRGLLGKSKGDRVKIQVPSGQLVYEIVDVAPPE